MIFCSVLPGQCFKVSTVDNSWLAAEALGSLLGRPLRKADATTCLPTDTVQQRLCLIARVVVRDAVSPRAFSLHSSSGKGLCLATIQVGGCMNRS